MGSCTYNVAKNVAHVITPFSKQANSYIKNSEDFVEIVRSLRIKEDEVMVSFDVRSLYTSVSVKDALSAVAEKLDSDITLQERSGFTSETVMNLLKLCLSATYFKFRDKFYELVDGLTMGSPVSPPVANVFMEKVRVKSVRVI